MKRRVLGLAGVFVLALGLRLAHVSATRASDPLFSAPSLDSEYYDQLAREVAAGDWLGGENLFVHPPGYPYFLAAVYAAMGETHRTPWPDRDYHTPRRVQALIGALSCVLVAVLGWQLGGGRVGLMGGVCAAVYGPLIYFDAELLAPVLLVFLDLVLQITLVSIARERGERVPFVRWTLAGLALGTSALVRPNIMLFVPVLLLWALVLCRARRVSWPRRLAGLLVFVVGVAAPVSVLTVRNHALSGRWVLFVVKGGFNLYLGNNPDAATTAKLRPGAEFYRIYRLPIDAGLDDPVAWDAWFYRKVARYAREHPAAFAGHVVHKVGRVFSGYEEKRNFAVYDARDHSWVVRLTAFIAGIAVPFGLIGPLGLVGLAMALRRRGPPGTGVILLFVGCYVASVALFYTADRYRLPIVPALIVYAALAARWLWTARRRAAGWALAAAALVVITNIGRPQPDPTHDAERSYYAGVAAARHGEVARSRALLERSRAQAPLSYTHFALSHHATDAGSDGVAARELRRAIAADPRQWTFHYSLALLYVRPRPALAREHLRRAAALDRTAPEPLLVLGDMARSDGDLQAARQHYTEALRRRPGYVLAFRRLLRVWGEDER